MGVLQVHLMLPPSFNLTVHFGYATMAMNPRIENFFFTMKMKSREALFEIKKKTSSHSYLWIIRLFSMKSPEITCLLASYLPSQLIIFGKK